MHLPTIFTEFDIKVLFVEFQQFWAEKIQEELAPLLIKNPALIGSSDERPSDQIKYPNIFENADELREFLMGTARKMAFECFILGITPEELHGRVLSEGVIAEIIDDQLKRDAKEVAEHGGIDETTEDEMKEAIEFLTLITRFERFARNETALLSRFDHVYNFMRDLEVQDDD